MSTTDILTGHRQDTAATFLSRLRLNDGHPRTQRALGDAQTLHSLVMSLFPDGPAQDARAAISVLYRIDEDGAATGQPATTDRPARILIIQSELEPDRDGSAWSPGMLRGDESQSAAGVETRDIGPAFSRISDGQRLGFRLRANPTKRLSLSRPQDPDRPNPDPLLTRHQQPRANGKEATGPRVALLRESEQIDWLVRQGERHGFGLIPVRGPTTDEGTPAPPYAVQVASVTARGLRRQTNRLTHLAVTFDGELTVIDPDRFRLALREGIGPAKAYGFGLLSVRPPR